MGLIWDDKTIKRAKKQNKETKIIWMLSLLFFGIISTMMLPEIDIVKISALTITGSVMIESAYSYIFKITHFRIPDDLSENKKSLTRLVFFLLSVYGFYIFWIGKDWV